MAISNDYEPFVLRTSDIGLGLSALRSLADDQLQLPEGVRLAVPDNLIRLAGYVRAGSFEHSQFLERVILNFQPQFARQRADYRDNEIAFRFASALLERYESNDIEVIEDVDEEVLAHLDESFPSYVISLSPPSHFVRLYLAKLYSWSLRESAMIVERGRRVINQVSHLITTIQFPDRLAAFFRIKDRFSIRLFAPLGGRPVKYFVCIAVAGLGLTYLSAGVAGLAIAVIDP